MLNTPDQLPAVLCVAHPGHELRVYGWLGLAKPEVFVLTDGSGRSGESRLDFTTSVLRETGARQGSFYGGLTDAEAYAAVLEGRPEPFMVAIDELTTALVRAGSAHLAGDAAEGYNAIHDVCRLIVNVAVERARRAGAAIENYEFPLTGSPAPNGREPAATIEVRLHPEQLERKLAAARACPDLAVDVEEALRSVGPTAFAREVLRLAPPGGPHDGLGEAVPFYEQRGDQQVRVGKYGRVLRRREHVLPLAAKLWSYRAAGSQ